MTPIQIILLVVLGAIGALLAIWALRGWLSHRTTGLFALVLVAAASAIIWPEATTRVARAVGIGRGADLLLYVMVVAMIVGFFWVYVRLIRLRRNLTLLVRHLAQAQASGPLDAVRPPSMPLADEQGSGQSTG